MGLSPIHIIGQSDWVIRLPGGGGSTESTLLLALLGAFIVFSLVRGAHLIADKIIGPTFLLFSVIAALLAVVYFGRLFDGSDDDPVPTITTEVRIDECNDVLLDRCPPLVNGTSE